MEKPFERLKRAREEAGFDSAAEFAREVGKPEATYRAHESGDRQFGPSDAKIYAAKVQEKALDIDWRWLLYGDDAPLPVMIPRPKPTPSPMTDEEALYTAELIADDAIKIYQPSKPEEAKPKLTAVIYRRLLEFARKD